MTAYPPPPGPPWPPPSSPPSSSPPPPTPPSSPSPPAARLAGPAARGPALRYDELLHRGRWGAHGWWRVSAGVPLLVVLLLVLQSGVVVVLGAFLALRGAGLAEIERQLTGEVATPAFLAAVNLGWALSIPAVWLVVWALHRLGPGWVASVTGRLRWRWLLACLGVAVVALLATLVVSALLPQPTDGTATSGQLNDFTARTRDFLLVVVLLTPLQAAGEEYAFRGYLTQAFGGAFSRFHPRVAQGVAVVVPALIFAAAHGLGQDPPVFVDRLAFGLVAGVLTIATGGLEAAIAMHVLNNLLAFGVALAFGDMTSALQPTGGSWWSLPTTLTQSVVYTASAVLVARWMGVATRSSPVVLSTPSGRV